jgi:hypothetical protein
MKYVLLITFSAFLAIEPSQAYIDPGSGSTIMSVIIGLIVSVGLLIKTFWYKITSLFAKKEVKK